MRKTVRAIAYGSVMAAAVAAALPSYALTAQDRVGTPLQAVIPAGYVAAVPAPAVVAESVYVTKDGVVREQVTAVAPSSVAGAGEPAAVVPAAVVVTDRTTPTDRAFIISNRGKPYINVNWGDVATFQVRDPVSGNQHLVKWRFDGIDNVVSFADIDPVAPWARNVRVYVNQNANPLHSSDMPFTL
jgi:hypothetical protein